MATKVARLCRMAHVTRLKCSLFSGKASFGCVKSKYVLLTQYIYNQNKQTMAQGSRILKILKVSQNLG